MSRLSLPGLLMAAALLSGTTARGGFLVNGDFEAGNVGFTASPAYTYSETTAGPGHIGVIRNPQAVFGGFLPIGDHTTGSGLMLLVDAATYSGPPPSFWMETVAVTPNASYTFSGFAREVSTDPNTAMLRFLVGATAIGPDFTLQPASQNGSWQQFSGTFNTGSSTSITLSLADASPNTAAGNDFVVDDLTLNTAAVPEPGSLVLAGIGAVVMAGYGSWCRCVRKSA